MTIRLEPEMYGNKRSTTVEGSYGEDIINLWIPKSQWSYFVNLYPAHLRIKFAFE